MVDTNSLFSRRTKAAVVRSWGCRESQCKLENAGIEGFMTRSRLRLRRHGHFGALVRWLMVVTHFA